MTLNDEMHKAQCEISIMASYWDKHIAPKLKRDMETRERLGTHTHKTPLTIDRQQK